MSSEAQNVIAGVVQKHQWHGGILGCGRGCDWRPSFDRTWACGEEDRLSREHAAHVAEEIDKALGGLRPEYIARHESGGGTIHGTRVNAEIAMRSYVVFPPGVDDPGSGRLTGIESRWVSGWSEA
ncbi:hypothetical protein SG4_84 [Mycobacterium phage SG4]|uniref:Uncharacterized protein n=1 Tax=Mycobacterium phage SG4 TaxID=2923001 RepID=G8I9V0_9CAUD|nr:hypothetical protein CL94_gp084 [Mycobacterium phage SG4]AER49494.1 hypothetical protein SG4_84 [Mycobacterium phage SG4]